MQHEFDAEQVGQPEEPPLAGGICPGSTSTHPGRPNQVKVGALTSIVSPAQLIGLQNDQQTQEAVARSSMH